MKVTYPITTSYCASWGPWECAREILQNGFDAGDCLVRYEPAAPRFGEIFDPAAPLPAGTLYVDNLGDIPREFLLFGESTKGEGDRGKFGEGLKLALLWAARAGRAASVQTSRDVWRPGLAKLDGFDAEVLEITVEESAGEPERVVVAIEIKPEEWCTIRERYLDDHTPRVLDDEYEAGTIYVGGLYVCKLDGFKHAYNLSPSAINLNRDRDIPSMWDVQYATSQILPPADALDAAVAGRADFMPAGTLLTRGHVAAWREKYGAATPIGVDEQDDLDADTPRRVVPGWLARGLRAFGGFIVRAVSRKSPTERLDAWLAKWRQHLTEASRIELEDIARCLKEKGGE